MRLPKLPYQIILAHTNITPLNKQLSARPTRLALASVINIAQHENRVTARVRKTTTYPLPRCNPSSNQANDITAQVPQQTLDASAVWEQTSALVIILLPLAHT